MFLPVLTMLVSIQSYEPLRGPFGFMTALLASPKDRSRLL